jgi:hypothetical protein
MCSWAPNMPRTQRWPKRSAVGISSGGFKLTHYRGATSHDQEVLAVRPTDQMLCHHREQIYLPSGGDSATRGSAVPGAAPSGQYSHHPSCRLRVQRHALLVVRVDDRTEPHRHGGTREPSNPSLGPDPLDFENNVIPCSSNAQISDPRSIALPIMACLLAGRDVTP